MSETSVDKIPLEEGISINGYEITRIGWVKPGEWFINEHGKPTKYSGKVTFIAAILQKTKWRKPRLEDLGQPRTIRYRDTHNTEWVLSVNDLFRGVGAIVAIYQNAFQIAEIDTDGEVDYNSETQWDQVEVCDESL